MSNDGNSSTHSSQFDFAGQDRLSELNADESPRYANTLAGDDGDLSAKLDPPEIQQWAVVNYLNREINSKFIIGFRSDFLNDQKGQRTGCQTKCTENTLYATRYIGSTIILRPEIRFDHSRDLAAYNAGRNHSQFFFGMDLICKF